MKRNILLFAPAFLLLYTATEVNAQYYGALGSTWNNPMSATASVMIQGAINRQMLERSIANQRGKTTSAPAATTTGSSATTPKTVTVKKTNYAVLRFKPVANSGVAKQIADAIGRNPQERTGLLEIMNTAKKAYESESASSGNANDIAGALVFFIAVNSMAYHQTDAPSDKITNALRDVLRDELSQRSEFASMTNLQKQKMSDWLVVVGGFVMTGYLDAAGEKNAQGLADYKELADTSFKIVLGVSAEKINLAELEKSLNN